MVLLLCRRPHVLAFIWLFDVRFAFAIPSLCDYSTCTYSVWAGVPVHFVWRRPVALSLWPPQCDGILGDTLPAPYKTLVTPSLSLVLVCHRQPVIPHTISPTLWTPNFLFRVPAMTPMWTLQSISLTK